MNIERISLNKVEAQWFSRNVTKTLMLMEAATSKDPNITERSTYRVLKAIEAEAQNIQLIMGMNPAADKFDFCLSRKQKKIIKTLIGNTISVLTDKIIPEYKRRELNDYLFDAETKASLLSTMLRKFR